MVYSVDFSVIVVNLAGMKKMVKNNPGDAKMALLSVVGLFGYISLIIGVILFFAIYVFNAGSHATLIAKENTKEQVLPFEKVFTKTHTKRCCKKYDRFQEEYIFRHLTVETYYIKADYYEFKIDKEFYDIIVENINANKIKKGDLVKIRKEADDHSSYDGGLYYQELSIGEVKILTYEQYAARQKSFIDKPHYLIPMYLILGIGLIGIKRYFIRKITRQRTTEVNLTM